MIRRVAIFGVVVAVVGVGAGCDASSPSGKPSRSAASPSSTPSLGASALAERDALAAYQSMWDAWVEAGKTSNPDAPALRTYTSGDALKLIVSSLATNQHNGQVTLGEIAIDPKVSELKPPETPVEATINDCVNDEKWLMYRSSGGLVDDVPGGRHSMTASIARVDGSWKVTAFTLGRTGTC